MWHFAADDHDRIRALQRIARAQRDASPRQRVRSEQKNKDRFDGQPAFGHRTDLKDPGAYAFVPQSVSMGRKRRVIVLYDKLASQTALKVTPLSNIRDG